jgi:hypothetical protein
MANRDKLIQAIETSHSKLKEEIMYHLEDVDHGQDEGENLDYDIVNAFEDAMNTIEDNNDYKDIQPYLKDLFIKIGYAVPKTREEIDRTIITSGKKYWFKKNGIFYDSVDSWERWINQ